MAAIDRLAFITSEGDLGLAGWEPDTPDESRVRTLLSLNHPLLLGPSSTQPLSLASPTWSPDGTRLCVSVICPGGSTQPSSRLLLVSLRDEEPRVLYSGAPGINAMIAPGLPHYANWSPAGDRIALLTQTPAGMTLVLVSVDADTEPHVLTSGTPLFSAWSPDGQTLLLHRGTDLLRLNLSGEHELEPLAGNIRAFQVPAWSPSGDRFALIRRRGGNASLNVMDVQGKETGLHPVPGRFGALAWSPAGDRLAFCALESDQPPRYRGIWLDSLDGSEAEMLVDETLTAYFWSADAKRLAYLTPSFSMRRLNWNVLELETRDVLHFGSFYPAPELNLMLTFFEQYAVSHRFWSASGRGLAVNGSIPSNGTPPELLDSHIYVQPVARGQAPRSLGLGIHASWSPTAVPGATS